MKLPDDKLLQDECSQTSLYEMSRNRLRVIEKLGEGNFGMVSVFNPPPKKKLAPAFALSRRPSHPRAGHVARPRTEEARARQG